MLSFLYKRFLLAYLLIVDKFKTSTKSLSEKILPTLVPSQPVLVRHEGRYFLFLNDWTTDNDISNLKISYGLTLKGNFKGISFIKKDNYLSLELPVQQQRLFIKITLPSHEIILGERLLDFKGTVNFRDVGGFVTEDERHVKWGKLFRSGHLYKLGREEHSIFDSLEVKAIIDFRGSQMLKRFPDRVPHRNQINCVHLPIESKGLEMRKLGRKILKDDLGDFDAAVILTKAYRDFIENALVETKTIFETLLKNKQATLLHCSAGKDRTGFFMALILKTLGVPMEQIERDYLASNYFRKKENDSMLEKARLFTDPKPLFPLLNVEVDFLRAAFDCIDERYGSFENYLTEGVGLSEAQLEQLKTIYLD